MLRRFRKRKSMFIIILISISLFFLWQNNDITVTEINYYNDKIPDGFNGYSIIHISDLHNKSFGKNQEYLLKKVRIAEPDIIVITGDLIDRRKYDLDIAMKFIDGAMKIAPIYYVSGNHEAWSKDYKNISQRLLDYGVKILDDNKVALKEGKHEIEILGLSDPDFLTSNYLEGTDLSKLKEELSKLSDDSTFQILLFHRPELFDLYTDENIDIIFSGHAHGGQFRIPLIGGLVAPDQGLFPKYTSGAYVRNQSTLIVSRGLGNSIIPVRIFNRPEIIKVTLLKK
ncbi:MAG: metallophosphoesterase [Firmicutes bacterium]|nr:metallophosphoesterase [Bacillota bacterium]